ncbi:MAG: PAS domain-containing protein [Methanobacterium sp. ERen5]|nr:MAG: PAS domain-containing protein [Methanobacterium sp. ERen5]
MPEKERFKEIFDKSPIGILIYGSDGKLVDANRSALKIVGCNWGTVLGMDLFYNPEIQEKLLDLDKTGPISFQGRLKEHVKNAEQICQNSSLFAQFYISSIESGYLVEIQDITEKREEQKNTCQ